MMLLQGLARSLRQRFAGLGTSCSGAVSSQGLSFKTASVAASLRGLATQRHGITGPFSARLSLPMRGLEEFLDSEKIAAGDKPITGRPWRVAELRKKSFEDLHKLWFVLYKEKNMLLTERLRAQRKNMPLIAGDRRQKVKRSMKAIRVVVGERQRVKQAALEARQREKRLQQRAEAAAMQAELGAGGTGEGNVGPKEEEPPRVAESGGTDTEVGVRRPSRRTRKGPPRWRRKTQRAP